MPNRLMTEDFEEGYLCHHCLAIFLSEDDFVNHAEKTGHRNKAKLKINAHVDIGKKEYLFFELAQ